MDRLSAPRIAGIFSIIGLVALSAPAAAQDFTAESPTIAAMKADRSGSTDEKWQRLRARGIPLVEAANDTAFAIVTFLWRGDSATTGVNLTTPFAALDSTYAPMSRLDGTTIWYRTFRVRQDGRFSYDFTPIVQPAPGAAAPAGATAPRALPDPEAKILVDNGRISMLELPRAIQDNLAAPRDNVPKGTMVIDTIDSKVLGAKRRLWIYTPPVDPRRSEPRGGYPLAVFADGRTYQVLVPAPTVLDNGLADGVLPPTVAVFVESVTATRLEEMGCNPKWDQFIIEEVIPWVAAKHHITKDPKRRVIGGTSLGGLSATCLAIRHPEAFGNVISASGSFWHGNEIDGEPEWVSRYLASHPKVPVRFYMQVGLLETFYGEYMNWPAAQPVMLSANRHVRTVLQAKGNDVSYHEAYTGHQSLSFRASLGHALKYLIGTGAGK